MKKLIIALAVFASATAAFADGGRYTMPLNGKGWKLWVDKAASWQHDRLYLPAEVNDLSKLPVNPPTGGWQMLTNNQKAMEVEVPGSVEEYTTTSDTPRPEHSLGVSWWYRTIRIPADRKDNRVILSFESVRMRAEVYLDGKLVAYDVVGETPFQADITPFVQPGKEQQLAVRVTNPGGNFHWQDFDAMTWGDYLIPPARGFSGIIGRVKLECVDNVHIGDIYMQNTPAITKANAIVTIENSGTKREKRDIEIKVCEKENGTVIYNKVLKGVQLPVGQHEVSFDVDAPGAKVWDLNSPNLYTCNVEIRKGKTVTDSDNETFGFRWFDVDGIGSDAVLRLNGRRIMLRSAISWGFFPATGLIATEEMAERQVRTAQQLGLNTLNFHRSMGSPVVLEKADELGLLYYEEPGGFHSASHDPFIRTIVNEKLQRMVRRDRSHPSLVIYNLINEFGGTFSRDKELVEKRMNDMRKAHAIDPSRIMTFTSGWANKQDAEEDAKAHMLPFDTLLHRKGWFDNHRAGGPATWTETFYKGPTDNLMFTDNNTEIFMRGEEGAISTPPRIEKIASELAATGKDGWDGKFWKSQYEAFTKYFSEKNLAPHFGTLDSLTMLMGNVSFEHQGRRIQGMRMQNLGDAYVVNGWEAMPYDNHSGIVDIYRNPKGDPKIMAYYTQPLHIAVATRNQVVRINDEAVVDFYIVNETNLSGNHTINISVADPEGNIIYRNSATVDIKGGETFGQKLLDGVVIPVKPVRDGFAGTYRIEATLTDSNGRVQCEGHDEIVAVDWSADDLAGKGAYYGDKNDPVAEFYASATGRRLPLFTEKAGKLDWIIVNRSSLDETTVIAPEYFKDATGKTTLQAAWFKDQDFHGEAGTTAMENVDRTFAEGAQPCTALPANQPFSVSWKGEITPPETGLYMIGAESDQGMRLHVNGEQILDEYHNNGDQLKKERPVMLEAGKPAKIELLYRQSRNSGTVKLKWSKPSSTTISPNALLDRVSNDGTTLILLGMTETWMKAVADYTGIAYNGYYAVGTNWVGGIHFVKRHPLFEGLPADDAMNWPYQAVVRDGDQRFGFRISGEEAVVGSYRTTPFELGTSVGVIPCGKGKIIFSTLDIAGNLNSPEGTAEVARKILCNYIKFSKN